MFLGEKRACCKTISSIILFLLNHLRVIYFSVFVGYVGKDIEKGLERCIPY